MHKGWIVWVVFGPLFMLAGAGLGQLVLSGRETRAYREPAAEPREAPPGPSAAQAAPLGLPSFAPLVAKVKHGVVGIRNVLDVTAAPAEDGKDDGGTAGVVTGSGFVIHESGLVVTNQHVIAGHAQIVVEIPDAPPCEADVVGEDAITDLAVLRLRDFTGRLTVLPLADSRRVRQGDWVVTVGDPFEFRQTVSAGIVSYVGRHIPEEGTLVTNEYLQVSAPVYPGSSGGPVLDLEGNVIGITRRSLSGSPGISFAVPSKIVKWVLDQMERNQGHVRRGFLGIKFQPWFGPTSERPGETREAGALVVRVVKDQPAHRAGIREGDVVVGWNGKPIDSAYELYDWISYAPPGSQTQVEVLRGDQRLAPIQVTLGEVADSNPKTPTNH